MRRLGAIEWATSSTHVIRKHSPSSNPDCIELGGGFVIYHGRHAVTNGAAFLGVLAGVTETVIDKAEKFCLDHGCSPRFWINELWTVPTLRASLLRRGYQVSFPLTFWIRRLRPEVRLDNEPSFFQRLLKLRAATEDDLGDWVHFMIRAFHDVDFPDQSLIDSYAALGFGIGCNPYLAICDGQMVGAGVLERNDDIAVLRTAATLQEYRGGGIQKSLIDLGLQLAVRMGCRIAVASTEAASISQRNVKRVSFEPIGYEYCLAKPQ